MDKMDEFVQDALDCIEYANGPTNSVWGAKRAAAGHPEPFGLKYLEIGNENGGRDYEARYALIAKAVREKYPDVKLVFDNSEPSTLIVSFHLQIRAIKLRPRLCDLVERGRQLIYKLLCPLYRSEDFTCQNHTCNAHCNHI